MDRGEGQRWHSAPGNYYSNVKKVSLDPKKRSSIKIILDQIIPEIIPPKNTKYVKHIQIKSDLLSDFWGRPMYLGAHILLPEGFMSHSPSPSVR